MMATIFQFVSIRKVIRTMPLVKDVPDSPLVTSPQILTRKNETSIAYHKVEGKAPGVIFMNGFMSDMNGGKALALEQLCRDREQAFLRFDYQGHGKSSGEFTHCTIGTWAKDALAALDQLTEGPQIIVGSSMGGWIMLLTAIARPARVIGLVGISAAPDFTANSLPQQLTTKQLAEIDEKGIIVVPSEYEDPYTITKMLLEEGNQHLVLRGEIPLDCPVRLIHGIKDISVPWKTALKIQKMMIFL